MALPGWCRLLRPRRRWFQYRLRTLFVLTTLVAVWLSYHAWRFQKEQAIVAGIKAHDPKATVVWVGPKWLQWFGKDLPPSIFHRVEAVKLQAVTKSLNELLDLRLHELVASNESTWRLIGTTSTSLQTKYSSGLRASN